MATPDQVRDQTEGSEPAGKEGVPHGGRLVARALKSRGVSRLFTLSGGHLFSIYDGCKAEGIEVIDFRHEQSAAFAAIGWAKATREPGVCALTAGCGVTNGMSAIASAQADGVPLVALGGRAPEMRWGRGSLQEIDHLPFVAPLVKSASTVKDPAEIATVTAEAIDAAQTPPFGPTFVDYPMDVVFMESRRRGAGSRPRARPARRARPTSPRSSSPRPSARRSWPAPTSTGARPSPSCASSPRRSGSPSSSTASAAAASRPTTSSTSPAPAAPASAGCDVALVIGVPLDFRLGFGGSIAEDANLIQLDFAPTRLEKTRSARPRAGR